MLNRIKTFAQSHLEAPWFYLMELSLWCKTALMWFLLWLYVLLILSSGMLGEIASHTKQIFGIAKSN